MASSATDPSAPRQRGRLPPEVSRILYVRNLPYKLSGDDMYDIFGKYGSIRQVRQGTTPEVKGRAFVVYDDIYDAKNALEHLNGFNVMGRYLVVLYYHPEKTQKKMDMDKSKKELEDLRKKFNAGQAAAAAPPPPPPPPPAESSS